jgi:hypothetical protein
MVVKKSVVVLIVIALVLAVTAIALRATDSDEVSTTRDSSSDQPDGGQVGVDILPSEVEDKMEEELQP